MSAISSTWAITRQRKNSRPVISLRSPRNKVRLHLRKIDFKKELEKLPSDTRALIELLIQSRSKVNGGIYETVTIWNKLRSYDKYWINFQFKSETQFLAYYCLPDGATLAHWTILVELFDHDTFVLLGDEVLLYMMRWVGQHQTDVEQRKRDYQAIFERYCRINETFNRAAFYEVVRNYTTERYGKSKLVSKTSRTILSPSKSRSLLQTQVIKDFLDYTRELEKLLAVNHEIVLPEKPESIRALESIVEL
jgi:hypothetical protein